MAFCTNCGLILEAGRFCPSCKTISMQYPRTTDPTVVRHTSTGKRVAFWSTVAGGTAMLAIVMVIGIAAVGFIILLDHDRRQMTALNNTSQPSSYRPDPAPPAVTVVDNSFSLPAMSYRQFDFTVTRPARLRGAYSAVGGKNDVNCMIVSGSSQIFSSGYTTGQHLDLNLQPGTYSLVFDNRQALITAKVITAKFIVQ